MRSRWLSVVPTFLLGCFGLCALGWKPARSTIPNDCANLDFSTTGRPVFMEKDGLAYGISMKRDLFKTGDVITVAIWLDNLTDKPKQYGLDCKPWDKGEIYTDQGRRVLSTREEMSTAGKGIALEVCTGATPLYTIPPHSCFGPRQLRQFYASWPIDYTLPPGKYWITPLKAETAQSLPVKAGKKSPMTSSGISFSVSPRTLN